MSHEQPSPYVFVVGCPRSGTTLLQRMLDAHPRLTVANDTHFIIDLFDNPEDLHFDSGLSRELVCRVQEYRRIHRLGLSSQDIEAAAGGCHTFVEFVERLYRLRAEKAGKQLSGEKTPNYVRFMPVLSRMFPGARFIHIIRDGRDVSMSMQSWAAKNLARGKRRGPARWSLWELDPLATTALYWKWQSGAGITAGSEFGQDRYHQVIYEQLVVEPEAQISVLSDFLEIPFSERMIFFHRGKTRPGRNRSAKRAWLPVTAGLRDWRRDMEQDDIAVFEGLAGQPLEFLGYELSGTRAAESAISRINFAREWWLENGKD